MKVITDSQISQLGISHAQCLKWVEEAFRSKHLADMPPKVSVIPYPDSFYTTMPCYLSGVERFGVKVVSRLPNSTPSINSKFLLFDARTSELLALMDANWITTMRTASVAVLSSRLFSRDFSNASFGFVGLGNIGRTILRMVLQITDSHNDMWILEYKDHAELARREFPMANIHSTSNREELVGNTDVLFSCVTVMHDQFLPPDKYPDGYTLIPVHMKGFQDCDVVFDHIFGDDEGQIRKFKNFSGFKTFNEVSDVILGKCKGRIRSKDRILVYNYGIALHDLWFASNIYDMLGKCNV